MNIRTKQFQLLTDIELVWKLMTDTYNHDTCRLAGPLDGQGLREARPFLA